MRYITAKKFHIKKMACFAQKLGFLTILTFALLLLGWHPGKTAFAGETRDMFEQAWTIFDANYSYFTYKNIDWNAVKAKYQGNFENELAPEAFAKNLNDMLQELHDWHVWVGTPDKKYFGYQGSYSVNYPKRFFRKYPRNGEYKTIGDNVIFHAIIDENIAYIVIDTLSTKAFSEITEERVNELFTAYAGTDGMIIDIRSNNGGNEENAAKFASHFTNTPLVYGHVKIRNKGQNHDDFGELITKTLQPSRGIIYTKPSVCLIGQRCMSSAEWFALMMKVSPNVILIGDKTRGGSGNPKEFELPNGVSFSVSSWIAYTDKMVEIEDKGIQPDILIPAEKSVDSEHDYVLEKAIRHIKDKQAFPTNPESSPAVKKVL